MLHFSLLFMLCLILSILVILPRIIERSGLNEYAISLGLLIICLFMNLKFIGPCIILIVE